MRLGAQVQTVSRPAELKTPQPHLLPVPGVRLAAASAGIYRRVRPDVALIAADPGTAAAAVFTRNAFRAAPVEVAEAHLSRAAPRFLVINAGNANAGTGAPGLEAARASCRAVAEAAGCREEEVLPFSTGVIGEPLPVDRLCAAVPALVGGLAEDRWLDVAQAIMTTDTRPKGASRRVGIGGVPVTVTGIAKGAGMIHPDMATLLVFMATDAAASPQLLGRLLSAAVDDSFNCISVDGDTSTNDSAVLLATGRSGASADADPAPFAAALNEVCAELAEAVVRDGEGATKFIAVCVEGGATRDECLAVARAVACSPLVKTAFFASDPNWGRILAAIGRAGLAGLDIARVQVWLDDVAIVENGQRAAGYTEEQGRQVMARQDVTVRIRLGRGEASLRFLTCDFSYDYVRINAEYRT